MILRNGSGPEFTVNANGPLALAGTVAAGASYSITVVTQPELQTCTVANGSGTANANVTNIAVSCADVAPPTLSMALQPTKAFRFVWTGGPDVPTYKLLEDPTGAAGFTEVGPDIPGASRTTDRLVPLHRRVSARYALRACAATRCIESNVVTVTGSLAEAVGYFKAANVTRGDQFGESIALSDDGRTLAVGVPFEDSAAVGLNGNPNNEDAAESGAVYVFTLTVGPVWVQQAYLKASNAQAGDRFGTQVALDGDTLAVGAPFEDGNGVGGQANNTAPAAGAVYVFRLADGAWSQQSYVKASNAAFADRFGFSVALSEDGATLAAAANEESRGSTGVNGDPNGPQVVESGAVYVY